MEFNKKLQELRKQRGITQEALAECLYVSRTAISKWESGRGYPNIDSLKAIAKFFSVTLDELLSSDEILTIAEQEGKKTERRVRDLVFGLLDIFMLLFLFLPLFAERSEAGVEEATLLSLGGVGLYLRILYFTVIIGLSLIGIMTLALQNCQTTAWMKTKVNISLILSAVSVFLFALGLHPYATVLAFILLVIKVVLLIKN